MRKNVKMKLTEITQNSGDGPKVVTLYQSNSDNLTVPVKVIQSNVDPSLAAKALQRIKKWLKEN